ncbi:hypothetical protein BE21_55715 [Sorangium cellulosum]|uniref:Uncharacterized protein n=1 Tax=Sorangium cellulosum TaxID=56 RepID=A0A150TBP9_SORCE|nr:hypothetical protein BE21_55715 [Sorangium cellulosum]
MSVPSASFQINGSRGSYTFQILSCNPQQPVSFMLPNQTYDPSRLQDSGDIGVRGSIRIINVTTFPRIAVPTTWNQNPIKLIISTVTTGEGDYTGNSAVLYGYYLGYGGDGLGFYLNQEQSTTAGQYGRSGIDCGINNSTQKIFLP